MKFSHTTATMTIYPGTTNVDLAFKVSENKKDPRKWMRFLEAKISNGFSISKEFISWVYENTLKFIYDYLKFYPMFMLLPIFKVQST